MVSLGILDELLQDEAVTEIMVNGSSAIFIEHCGRFQRWQKAFNDDGEVYAVIEHILSPLGKRVSADLPFTDARLPDGSRVNIVIPPVSLTGPMITIRKFSDNRRSVAYLIEQATLNDSMRDFLRLCVLMRMNIIISGGTGTGKTTLLNALSSFVPENERIITIEDTAELRLVHEHVARLEARPPDGEGKNGITIRQLLANALRMRPDRIIIGECRAGETLDMIQAMNTGHRGSMTTLHANSPRDCLKRIETMALMAGYDLPLRAVREQIAAALHILVHIDRTPAGVRRITSIAEVTGMEGEIITLAPVFTFSSDISNPQGCASGCFKASGNIPRFIEEARLKGMTINLELFA